MINLSPDDEAKLDGTSISLLTYADNIVLVGNNINTVKSLCVKYV